MISSRFLTLAFAFALGLLVLGPSEAAQAQKHDCPSLAELRLPDVRIAEAEAVPAGEDVPMAHCRVKGTIGREIGFEVLLPETWNGRFVMGGGGGFVGSIQNSAAWTVGLGYATAGTDTGHQGRDASWALNAPERQVNFGHVAIHRTTEVAKAVIRAYYGSGADYAYFMGCSRGGGQALMEAQRYPADFDGIVAGAPAYDWTGFGAEMIRNMQKSFPDPSAVSEPIVTPDQLRFLESRILDACDALDGVEDGVMEDPRDCAFDLASIPTCAAAPNPECLTEAQRSAITEIYAPTRTPDGRVVHPGWAFGGEGQPGGWTIWITGVEEFLLQQFGGQYGSLHQFFGAEMYKYFVFGDPDWNYATYDFSHWAEETAFAAAALNATDPDLGPFASQGGRLILWHGWSDPALSALSSIAYRDSVMAIDPSADDYFRMFLMPGVLHCGNGTGPDQADWLSPIVSWVENGIAPDRVVATKSDDDGALVRSRPLCPYPQRAVHDGSGSTDEADSFVCRMP